MWALAITHINSEFAVGRRLDQLPLQNYVFAQKILKVERGQKRELLRAAFPGYVFVDVIDQFWRDVIELKGVLDFFRGLDDQPMPVQERTIENMLSRCNGGTILPDQFAPPNRLTMGAKICIRDGCHNAAAGSEGIYQYPTNIGRSCILLPWLGRMTQVEVDDDDLDLLHELPKRKDKKRRHGKRGRRGNQHKHHHATAQ